MNSSLTKQPETATSWRSRIPEDLRNHLVAKIVRRITSNSDQLAANDPRIEELQKIARKSEKEMFESAKDLEEYYEFLAVKTYNLQKQWEKEHARAQ